MRLICCHSSRRAVKWAMSACALLAVGGVVPGAAFGQPASGAASGGSGGAAPVAGQPPAGTGAAGGAGAQAAGGQADKPEPPKLPKSGLLSSAVEAGYSSRTIGNVFGGNSLDEENQNPISGSVVRQGNQWAATVKNNSKDYFSISLRVVQVAMNDSSLRSDFFSVSLNPGESITRTFTRATGVAGVQLWVNSWTWRPGKDRARAAAGTPGPGTPVAGSGAPGNSAAGDRGAVRGNNR